MHSKWSPQNTLSCLFKLAIIYIYPKTTYKIQLCIYCLYGWALLPRLLDNLFIRGWYLPQIIYNHIYLFVCNTHQPHKHHIRQTIRRIFNGNIKYVYASTKKYTPPIAHNVCHMCDAAGDTRVVYDFIRIQTILFIHPRYDTSIYTIERCVNLG